MPKIYNQILYTCDYCGTSYTEKNNLIHHILKCHPSKLKKRILLPCKYCKYYFPSDITQRKAHVLQFHRTEHIRDIKDLKQKCSLSFICDYCNMKFDVKHKLIAHIRNIHIKSEKSDKIYSCTMCKSYFKTPGWLGRHIMKCHVNKDEKVPDDTTKEVNDVMSNLKILNTQSDILACAIGASELNFGNLNVETESTLPQSDILAQAIGTTKLDFVPNLNIDKLEVIKENGTTVIKCSLCKFKTKRISLLKRHMASHSTAKQYQCPHCPTKCRYLYNLKQHIIVKHNNNNVDTKKKRVKKNTINRIDSLNALPILFENSNLSIDDSILNDMLKDIPNDIELPSSLIDIDKVLKTSELITPAAEIPITRTVSDSNKECIEPVSKIGSESNFDAIFKTPIAYKVTTAIKTLRDHDYCSEKVIDASENKYSNNYESGNSNIVTKASEATETSLNSVATSNKLIEIPDASDINIEDLLDLAEICYPNPLVNIEHNNADVDNEKHMKISAQIASEHTSNKSDKSTQKVVILKNELLCGGRQYLPPKTSNKETTQKVENLKDELLCGIKQTVLPIHNVINDCIIYGKEINPNYLNNVNEIFPNTVFTSNIDTVNNNFTTLEVVSKSKVETSYKFSNQNITNAVNTPIITDTESGATIGASNSLQEGNVIINNTIIDNNIHETYDLIASSTAPTQTEDNNMITNKDLPTVDQYVNFDLDVILSADSNKQVTMEQIKSIFGNTPEPNDNLNLSPLGKENSPPRQPVSNDTFQLTSESELIYNVNDIIGALERSNQSAGTELSVPLSNILACDPSHEDDEEAIKNAIANEVMCDDGNTEELVMKLLSQDTIKTLSNAKYGIFCEICNRTFRRVRNLREHIKLVHNKQEYTCDMCGKILHAYKSLKVHMKSHSAKVQCKVCDKFMAASSMSIHMSIHNNNKPYLCALCGLRFATFSKKKNHILRSHLRTDTPSTKSSLVDMINEIDQSSGDDEAIPPVLTACVNLILEKRRQYKPVEDSRKRKVNLKEFECKHCNKVFNYLFNYKRHLQTHNTEDNNKMNRPNCRRRKIQKHVTSLGGLE